MQEAESLGLWAYGQKDIFCPSGQIISRVSNVQEDWLSWTTVDQSEWHLHPSLFLELIVLDLFATLDNSQLPGFFSRYPAPGAEGIDALCSPWPQGLLYAFPSLPLILGVVRKVLEEKVQIILLAPPLLAQETMVRQPDEPVGGATLEEISGHDLPQPEGLGTSRPAVAPVDRLNGES